MWYGVLYKVLCKVLRFSLDKILC